MALARPLLFTLVGVTTIDPQALATISGGNRFSDGCRYGLAYNRSTTTFGQLFACVIGGVQEVVNTKATHGTLSVP